MNKCNCGCGKYLTIEERFLQKVEIKNECWEWQGKLDKNGYGRFAVNRKNIRSHRFSYEFYIGKIPNGLVIDHLCRNKRCVNPKHLEPVTNKENILRGLGLASLNSKKIYCINGHLLKNKNLYVQKKTGKRFCRECDRRRGRELYIRKKKNDTTK